VVSRSGFEAIRLPPNGEVIVMRADGSDQHAVIPIRFHSVSATLPSLPWVNQAGARSPEGLPEEDTPMDGGSPRSG
jgi:hypothetical protein